MPRGALLPRFAALALACAGASAAARPDVSPPLRLLPPVVSPGSLRLEVVATDPAIDRVVFYLGDTEVGEDRSPPFRLRVDVQPGERPRAVRALALDREGRPLGEHALTWTGGRGSFDVAIRRVESDPAAGWVDVEVAVEVPPGERLDRVELYRNQTRVARSWETPLRARVPTPTPAPGDFLRGVAVLADGATLEDAQLLASPDPGERLDVHLVEVVAVATDRRGGPVHGLGRGDFQVLLDGRTLPVTRVQEARNVPLTLGLLVDSSSSMRPIMDETLEAARRFLDRSLAPGDRAFVVDIGTRPRIVHGLTGDAGALAASFATLEPDGDTALFDSLALAAVDLQQLPGRRAVVVLSDGRDSSSHLDLGRCLDLARRAGIPVYVLSLGGLADLTTRPDQNFRLDAFARETGGRLYAVTSAGDVERAYGEIGAELRSQYVLGVVADRLLDGDEIAGLQVRAREGRWRVQVARRGDGG